MANHNKSPYAKRRIKPKKVDNTINPFDKELKSKRNKKIIGIVAVIIVVVMVGTMFLPYLSGQNNINYKLPEEVLKAKEDTSKQTFSVNSISLGQTFNRSEDDYYVLFGNQDDLMSVQEKLLTKNVYLVDPNLSVNASLKKDINEGKTLPSQPSEIKIKDQIALIRIKNHKTVTFLNTQKAVNEYVKKLK